jgi:hypothetical protein
MSRSECRIELRAVSITLAAFFRLGNHVGLPLLVYQRIKAHNDIVHTRHSLCLLRRMAKPIDRLPLFPDQKCVRISPESCVQ